MNWAGEQRTGSPARKLVLLVLANWATPEGFVRLVDAEALAEQAEQHRATVFRHLRALEAAGVLTREGGRSGNSGRFGTISGRLHLDRRIAAEAAVSDEGADQAPDSTESQIATRAATESHSYATRTESHSYATPTYSPESNLTLESPPLPPDGAQEGAIDWAAFLASYPVNSAMSLTAAKEEFLKLSIKDRARAIRWAKSVKAEIAGKRREPLAAVVWLRKREFEALEEREQGVAKAAGVAPLIFVAKGTRAWEAWIVAGHPRALVTGEKGSNRTGWYFRSRSLFPQGPKT